MYDGRYNVIICINTRGSIVNTESHSQLAAFIWSVADLLRGDFKQSQYGRIILPFTLLRRLECVLEPTKAAVLDAAHAHQAKPEAVREKLLLRAAEQPFFNASKLTLGTLSDTQTADDLMSYVQSFSQDAREIFEHFEFEGFVQQLSASNLLYQVVQRFAAIDMSPQRLTNYGMGLVFEELIRKFAESSNETAGETRHSELRRWLWAHGFALAADRPVQAAGRWYAVMAAEYTGERKEASFTECLFGRTGEWPEGAGYAAWQKAKLPRFRLGVPDGTALAEEIDTLLESSPSQAASRPALPKGES